MVRGGNNALLRHKAGDEGRGDTPVAKAQRCEQRCDPARQQGQNAGLRVRCQAEPEVKVLQEPNDDGGYKDDRKRPLEEIRAFSQSSWATFFRPGRR